MITHRLRPPVEYTPRPEWAAGLGGALAAFYFKNRVNERAAKGEREGIGS